MVRRDNVLTPFVGVWDGTYNSQPVKLAPDGSYPEVTHRFRLSIIEENKTIKGRLRDLGNGEPGPIPIRNVGYFDGRLCFDVDLHQQDERWCVYVAGNNMTGAWTTGPEGGKELEGMGVGTRLFVVSARRLLQKGSRTGGERNRTSGN